MTDNHRHPHLVLTVEARLGICDRPRRAGAVPVAETTFRVLVIPPDEARLDLDGMPDHHRAVTIARYLAEMTSDILDRLELSWSVGGGEVEVLAPDDPSEVLTRSVQAAEQARRAALN